MTVISMSAMVAGSDRRWIDGIWLEEGESGGEDYGLNRKCRHLLLYGPKDADWKSGAINVVASKPSHALTLILGGNHPPIARSQVVFVQS